MKRFIAVLSSLLVLPAFAEVAPVYYDEIVEYTDDMIDAIDEAAEDQAQTEKQQVLTPRKAINRSTSRAVSAATTGGSQRANNSTRTVASTRNSQKISRGTVSRNTQNNKTSARKVVTSRTTKSTKPTTARVSVNNSSVAAVRGYSSDSVQPVTVLEDSRYPLYISNGNGEVVANDVVITNTKTARVGVGSRRATTRNSSVTTPIITQEEISDTTTNLSAIAELTDYCKAQYAACMDNYCNVLDDNQGRCSCSKNLKNYEKTEQALTSATEQFKEAIQKIKYIGLTSDQINSLFTETEAELTMKTKTDSSNLKNSLDTIKRKIIDVSSGAATPSTGNISVDLSGLLDIDFASGFDLGSFLGTTTTNANSVSNQRGETLYKTATQRCKVAVLNSCAAQGIEANIITNAYDLEIDKQCIAYERSLNDANSEMRDNVTNATTILQQARLLLVQNKNAYDLRGCVAEIDACMQDEYVCGTDYELCLDPTGKYLANGEIVKGGTPGTSGGTVKNKKTICDPNGTQSGGSGESQSGGSGESQSGGSGESSDDCESMDTWTSGGMYELYSTWNYTDGSNTVNAWGGGKSENLGDYIEAALTNWKSNYKNSVVSDDMATYLLQKIGYIDSKDNDKVHGMCASVMKQCQDYTFDSKRNKSYQPVNEVVRQYLAATLTKIKVQQDAILADYAEGCRSDVSSCLSTNGYDETNTTTTASTTAVNACRAEIATCMSVGGYKPKDSSTLTLRAMRDWVASMLKVCSANYYLFDNGTDTVSCKPCETATVVNPSSGEPSTVPLESNGGQETMCHCPDGYNDYNDTVTSGGTTTVTFKCIKSN